MIMSIAVVSASAGVRIDWQINWGAYTHDAPNVVDDPSAYQLLGNYSIVWQLVYAGADNQIDAPDLNNAINGWVGDDDSVWATRTIAQGGGVASDGTKWDSWLIWDGLTGDTVYRNYAWSTAGYVYQRIYEGTPQELSWYFDSAPLSYGTGFDSSNEHLTPDYLRSGTSTNGIQPNQQFPAAPVPEPATMGLLGLGALVMAIRRRRS